MNGRIRSWLRRGGVAAALVGAIPLAFPASGVVHAAATTTVAFYSMDEASDATVLVDSSGNARNGTIGAEVVRGVQVDGATAHRFPLVPTAQPPTHPEHLDRIPDSALLDPGTDDYAVTIRYRTTENFGNLVQKGQNATVGGYWKFEAPQGIVTCLFKGSSGAQRAVNSITALNDGQWHTVRCERTTTALTMTVDGVRTQRLSGTPGNIANDREITIGGKGQCDQITVTCDYFAGDIDYVRIEKGSGGPANVPPTAGFTPSCVGLICSFASTSTDSDGAIQTFAWDFGDATTGQYANPNHTYAAEGTYPVTLTVTDDRGATATVTQDVTVAPASEIISYVGANAAGANVMTHTTTVPAGVQAGDGLLMFFSDNNNATIGAPTGVTGWTVIDTVSGGYGTTRAWRKVAGAGDAGATVRVPLSKQAKGSLIVVAYHGTSPVNPVASFARVADLPSSANHPTPIASVADSLSWAVSYWMHGDSTTSSLTAPAGVTARAGASQTGSGRVTTLLADTGAAVPAGSYGGIVLTAPTASTTSSAWTIILRPDNGPIVNTPPTAVATASCLSFDCTFSGSGSSDSDGTVQSYAWDFGDGATGTGVAPQHTYANPGSYVVSLTVTDDLNGTGSTTTNVTVPYTPPVNVITYVGGASMYAGSATFSVTVPAGVQQGDGLLLFFAANSTTSVSTPTGVTGWTSLGTVTAGSMRSRVWRKVAGPADAGATVTITLGASAKGGFSVQAYHGTDTSNPVAAFASAPLTDNSASRTTPVVPVAGTQSWAVSYWNHMDSITSALTPPAGVTTRSSGTQTSSNRVTSLIADSNGLVPSGSYGGLTATAPAASTSASAWTIVLAPLAGPPPNAAPHAAFTSSCTNYDCTFDATGSTDSDGTIQSYAWDFGDGVTTTGPTAAHTYTSDGTFTVSMTVSDDDLATDAATKQVTVPQTTPTDVITFVGQASSNANAVTHTVTIPAAVQAGDGLVLFFAENTAATITDPAGWTLLDTAVGGSSTTRVWRKVAGASDAGANVTVQVSAISKAGLTVMAYRGTSTTDPVAAYAANGSAVSTTARTTPVATVAGSQSWAISYWAHKDSTTNALTPPSGVTVRASGTQTSGGRITTLLADSNGIVPTGTYGGLVATAAASSSAGATWTIILAPIG